jgi:hypothetical protein
VKRRPCSVSPFDVSAFVGFRLPPEVILLAVRWYLRFGLSYRDLEVDHVTLFRWVQPFTPLLVEAARPCRHTVGSRWFVDETYVKVAGIWRYVYGRSTSTVRWETGSGSRYAQSHDMQREAAAARDSQHGSNTSRDSSGNYWSGKDLTTSRGCGTPHHFRLTQN